jgi:hypothetical protein
MHARFADSRRSASTPVLALGGNPAVSISCITKAPTSGLEAHASSKPPPLSKATTRSSATCSFMHAVMKRKRDSCPPLHIGSANRTGTGEPLAGDDSPSAPSVRKSLIIRRGPDAASGESTPEWRALDDADIPSWREF